MDSQTSSCMRYFESIHERFLSKLPRETAGVPLKKLMYEAKNNRYNNRYVWDEEKLAEITKAREIGISYREIGERYGASQTTIKTLCRRHNIKSPTCYTPSLKLEPPASKP